jgi:GNAT superfamily N-acetyltransferase
MSINIRPARLSDAPAIVDLSEQKRTQYQQYQPTFWHKATDAREKQLSFFKHLIERNDVITLVYEQESEIEGFAIADFVNAPPVYDPGGPTCRIDDFCLASESQWEAVGSALLNEVQRIAKEQGAAQMVVVCAHRDAPKRTMLAAPGFSIASEWYVRDL